MSDRARDAIAAAILHRGRALLCVAQEADHHAASALVGLERAGLAVVDRDVANLGAHVDRLTTRHSRTCGYHHGGLCNCDMFDAFVALDRVRAREEAS